MADKTKLLHRDDAHKVEQINPELCVIISIAVVLILSTCINPMKLYTRSIR